LYPFKFLKAYKLISKRLLGRSLMVFFVLLFVFIVLLFVFLMLLMMFLMLLMMFLMLFVMFLMLFVMFLMLFVMFLMLLMMFLMLLMVFPMLLRMFLMMFLVISMMMVIMVTPVPDVPVHDSLVNDGRSTHHPLHVCVGGGSRGLEKKEGNCSVLEFLNNLLGLGTV